MSDGLRRGTFQRDLNERFGYLPLEKRDGRSIGLPSRLSANAPARDERERLLARVTAHGFIDVYSGVRIAKSDHAPRVTSRT